jgi:hypothetical protein
VKVGGITVCNRTGCQGNGKEQRAEHAVCRRVAVRHNGC